MGRKFTIALFLMSLVGAFQQVLIAQTCTAETDRTGPVISGLSASPNSLWPPNHKMVPVNVNYAVSDNCGGAISCAVTVTSNEPVNSIGDGNTWPDWIVVNNHHVKLRAERAGNRSGRIYTIRVRCVDRFGNATVRTTAVTVPHDMSGKQSGQLSVRVAPNPSSGQFSINVSSKNTRDRISMRILDLSGKVYESRAGIVSGQTISVGNNLKRGIYQLELIQKGEILKVKIQKTGN